MSWSCCWTIPPCQAEAVCSRTRRGVHPTWKGTPSSNMISIWIICADYSYRNGGEVASKARFLLLRSQQIPRWKMEASSVSLSALLPKVWSQQVSPLRGVVEGPDRATRPPWQQGERWIRKPQMFINRAGSTPSPGRVAALSCPWRGVGFGREVVRGLDQRGRTTPSLLLTASC